MIVKIYDIEESIAVRGTMDGARYKRPEDAEISFDAPIEYALTIRKMGDTLHISGPVHSVLKLTCDRCLETFTLPVDAQMNVELAPKGDAPKVAEMELKGDEMNLEYYEGEELEIDPYIFEEVMLAVPLKSLCSEGCKGICPGCGKNRNTGECACPASDGTVLGDKLKTFLQEH
jgi:uncharacterized protein